MQAEAVNAAAEHRAAVEGLKAQIEGLTLVGTLCLWWLLKFQELPLRMWHWRLGTGLVRVVLRFDRYW
jgi:hypothetical protein